jgi:hypothetical protein
MPTKIKIQYFILAFIIIFTCCTIQKNSGNEGITEIQFLQELRSNPVQNHRAAYWFSQLSLKKKREYAEKIGHILLVSPKTNEFVFAIGADHSPYPWTLIVAPKRLDLNQQNTFTYILRNDRNEWGIIWSVQQSYKTEIKEGEPIFQKSPPSKGSAGFTLWIPATGWEYVGPDLSKKGNK